tara:strand:+ start:5694 stop:6116 length:423 start_codon:yes stop_codon:yes gene_type:complete
VSDYYYGQFSTEHLLKMKRGIQLYNSGHYWECHEELEDLWLEDAGDNARYIYWAVLQVATALFHWSDGNLAGATGQWRRALKKMSKSEQLHVESEVLYNNLSWETFKNTARTISDNPELKDFEKLSKFKFQDPSQWQVDQ